jgi:chorismate lyase/3-hydroxybenzoate synthase
MPHHATKMSLMPRLSATKPAVSPPPHEPVVRRAILPSPPPWVYRFLSQHDVAPRPAKFVMREAGVEVAHLAGGGSAVLIRARVKGARAMDAVGFEAVTARAYRAVRAAVGPAMHPVRFWNYLPAIHEPMDERRDRYMVFNAGRFTALSEWFGGADMLPARLPAASGVGHGGDDLEIHCLAFDHPCQAIENPRQIPAFRYSQRYGPLPPCFARATVVRDPAGADGERRPLLVVAGTASIRGEQSVHQGNLAAQLQETAMNLRALIGAAEARADSGSGQSAVASADPLASFLDLCAYYVRRQDATLIESYVRENFGTVAHLQMVQADICRADLLVEIEGIARLRDVH